MDKIITIDGREVGFRATALTPRLYRHKIGRDIIQDLNSLRKAYAKAATLPADATEEEKRRPSFRYWTWKFLKTPPG